MSRNGFQPLTLHADLRKELAHDQQCFLVRSWNASTLELEADATHFGFGIEQTASLEGAAGLFTLADRMYFALPGAGRVAGSGSGLVISQFGYRGLFMIGGPIESRGRLRYIDSCSDTLLISPIVQGEACLNYLHIPPHTPQTAHTHPSFRVGLIVGGRGICRTPSGDTELSPGMAFVIPAAGLHSFHTEDDSLDVIAFHPDSDFGPTHDDHPMVNRTIISGISASHSAVRSPADTRLVLPHAHGGSPK